MTVLLILSVVLLDVAAFTCMKLTQAGRRWPLLLMALCYGLELVCQSLALRHVSLGTAYALWGGGGTALTAVVGAVWFREKLNGWKAAALACTATGVVGLNLVN